MVIPILPEDMDPDGIVSELQTAMAMTVPKMGGIAHISESKVSASNTVTQSTSVLQGAHNVNIAGTTFSVVGGDQINYTGTPRTLS